ncbi:hypothetical protein WJX82_008304 [Trebouxia sp. C0006]
MSIRTALQPHCRLHPRHQFSCAGLCAGARPAVPISSFAQRTTAQSTCFAAVVAPDVAEESASAQTAEHTNNRATTQQSSGASHVESCYPTKTINCSDAHTRTLSKEPAARKPVPKGSSKSTCFLLALMSITLQCMVSPNVLTGLGPSGEREHPSWHDEYQCFTPVGCLHLLVLPDVAVLAQRAQGV